MGELVRNALAAIRPHRRDSGNGRRYPGLLSLPDTAIDSNRAFLKLCVVTGGVMLADRIAGSLLTDEIQHDTPEAAIIGFLDSRLQFLGSSLITFRKTLKRDFGFFKDEGVAISDDNEPFQVSRSFSPIIDGEDYDVTRVLKLEFSPDTNAITEISVEKYTYPYHSSGDTTKLISSLVNKLGLRKNSRGQREGYVTEIKDGEITYQRSTDFVSGQPSLQDGDISQFFTLVTNAVNIFYM